MNVKITANSSKSRFDTREDFEKSSKIQTEFDNKLSSINAVALQNSNDPSQFKLEIYKDIEELGKIRAEFDVFLRSIVDDDVIFYGFDWLKIMTPLYIEEDTCLYFLIIRRNFRIVGFIPLQLQRRTLAKGLIRRLTFYGDIPTPLMNPLHKIYFNLSVKNHPQLMSHIFCQYLRDAWDEIYLSNVPEDQVAYWQELPGCRVKPSGMRTHISDIQCGAENYFNNTLTTKKRKQLYGLRRKIEKDFSNVKFEQTAKLTDTEIQQAREIYIKRQQSVAQRSNNDRTYILGAKESEHYFIQLLDWAAQTKHARHYLIKINDKIAGFTLGFTSGKTLYIYVTAFDENYARYSVISVLYLHMCETEHARFSTRQINWLPGESQFKQTYTNIKIRNHHIEIKNKRAISFLKRLYINPVRKIKTAINKLRRI